MEPSRMRSTLLAALALSLAPCTLPAQQPASPIRLAVDSLLVATRAETVMVGLGPRFLNEIVVLVPDLSADEMRALAAAVEEAFAPAAVREDLASALAADAPPDLLWYLVARHRAGAIGELARTAAAFRPQGTVNEFLASSGAPPRDRLQRMVQLAELEGTGTLDLLLDESLQELAHGLVTQLGGRLATFERMSEARFESAYRDRVLRLGFANLHRLQPVSEELLDRALDELSGEAGRWYADAYSAAVIGAASAAVSRVAALTVVGAEPPATTTVDEGLHCQGPPCLLWVDWDGPEPDAFNLRFGAPGALGARMMDNLGSTHFRIGGGPGEQRFMIRLEPRLTTRICDFMSGTDTEQCDVIGQLSVEFRGRYGELPNPPAFTIINRCGSNAALHVDAFAAFVAARIQHALYRPSDPPPQTPRC